MPGPARPTRPSDRPTVRPSDRPTVRPSDRPSDRPSVRPTPRYPRAGSAASRILMGSVAFRFEQGTDSKRQPTAGPDRRR
ncbi:PT domain-containing protein [Streptomyces sp. SAS_272]